MRNVVSSGAERRVSGRAFDLPLRRRWCEAPVLLSGHPKGVMMSRSDESLEEIGVGIQGSDWLVDDDDDLNCDRTAVDFVYESDDAVEIEVDSAVDVVCEADDLLVIKEADDLVEIKDGFCSLNAFPQARYLLGLWTSR
jgi:hypothetical protein